MSRKFKSRYANVNLLPVLRSDRKWTSLYFTILWFGMVAGVTEFIFTSNLMKLGMTWYQAILTIFLGNLIIYVILFFIGGIGAKYGISFPVLFRCGFGLEGAKLTAILRAVVALGWFSILTWEGCRCLFKIFSIVLPGLKYFSGEIFGCNILMFFCLIVLILLQFYIAFGGMTAIIRLQFICVPIIIICTVILFFHLDIEGVFKLSNVNNILSPDIKEFNLDIFITGLVATIAFWSSLATNICDFTRFAKNQKAHIIGTFIGLPLGMLLVTFIGVLTAGFSSIKFGRVIWDPLVFFETAKDCNLIILGYLIVLFSVITTNMAANVVPIANTISSLFPKLFSFRLCCVCGCLIGLFFLPFNASKDSASYIYLWLMGYATLTGAISGIILTDFYILRKMKIKIKMLYKVKGDYYYHKGWNIAGFVSLILAALPILPGFLIHYKIIAFSGDIGTIFLFLYSYSWFIAIFIASVAYYFLMKMIYLK